QAALERERSGALLQEHERALTRFTLLELFAEPEVRRRTLIAFAMSLATTLAWWGISAWLPPYIASVAAKAGLSGPQWASFAGMAAGAIPDQDTRHRGGVLLQHAALHRLDRAAGGRNPHRQLRRLQQRSHDGGGDLLSRPRQRPVPAGDPG